MIIFYFDLVFFDEEGREILNLWFCLKFFLVLVDYILDENSFMNIYDFVDFFKKESVIDICVIKIGGIR